MRYLLFTFLLISIVVLPIEGQPKRTTRPKAPKVFTIKGDRNLPPAKVEEASFGTVVEKYVSDYELNTDGTGVETRTMQKRCLSAFCVDALGVFRQVFNGDLQKVKVIDAYILKPDGTQTKIPAAAITDRATDQAEAAPGFSSLRELQVKFDGLNVGDAAFLKFEARTTRPTFDGRFDSLEVFPLVYDWKSVEINVSAPVGFQLFIESVGLDGGKLPDQNGRSRWQYKKADISKIALEPVMYDVTAVSPRFALTTFSDVNALGAAFWEGFKNKAVVTPEIQTLADEITKDAKTPVERAAAIYDWVNKNIRYLSIVLDRGGWIPHSSSEIVKNGYGDCKDYTTIIYTLLKAKGIESTPVLIRSEIGDWFPSVPTADYFNHAILYIPDMKLFADATSPNTRLGLLHQTLVGKRAVLAGEKRGIIEVPKDNPDDNQMISELTLDFADNGSLTARTRNTFLGRSEILFRPLFTSSVVQKNPEIFVSTLLAYYGLNGTGNIVSVGNPHNVGEAFNIEVESRLPNFTTFTPKGRLEIPPGLNMISMASMEMVATTDSRKTNVSVGALKVREKIGVNLPASVRLLSGPAAIDFSNVAGSLRSSSEIKDGSLHYVRELVIKKDVITPADYPALKALVTKLSESSLLTVEYSADASLLSAKSRELRASGAKRNGPQAKEANPGYLTAKLTPAELRRLEKKLTDQPDDVDSRIRLITYYSVFEPKKTPLTEAASVRHRVWLIENHPDIDEMRFFGFSRQQFSPASIDILKKAWVSKVAKEKDSMSIRINAISSLKEFAPDAATMLAEEGAKLDPQNYQLPMLVAEINASIQNKATGAEAESAARKVLDQGSRALVLLKKERSHERDAERARILKTLCRAAIRTGDVEAAASFARELVLDFGQSSDQGIYDEAAHIGNTTLGLVEIRRNNIAKASEHLLASIRAPLRMEYNNLSRIETSLVKELYAKGEKAATLEFLKLCLTIPNFKIYPESYADDVHALKLWIGQIEKGMTPNFDFSAPESKLPLPKGVIRPESKASRSQE